jgi:hypothetical protein
MCPRMKSLVCSVPWTIRSPRRYVPWKTRPLDDTSLGYHVPDRRVHRGTSVTSQLREMYAQSYT